jgi:hypothetical protein
MKPRSQTWDPEQGIDHLHHCDRRLVVFTCLWSPHSSICSLCGHVDLYIGYIPCKWKQICAIGLAAVAAKDPRCAAMVAQASFWRLGCRASWWSAAALASMSVVCRGRGDRSDPQVSSLPFSCLLHCFSPCLNVRYTRKL